MLQLPHLLRRRRISRTRPVCLRIRHLIRNEDNFSLQLLVPDGSFHFLQKSDLQNIEHPSQSLMPTNYRERLTSTELNDLVSYLMNAVSAPHPASNPTQTENPTE